MSTRPDKPGVFDNDFEPDLTDPDNPEWNEADFAQALRPEDFPDWVFKAFPNTTRPVRGAQKSPTKTPISLRVDADVVERYRATGPGWQGRMNAVLRKGSEAL